MPLKRTKAIEKWLSQLETINIEAEELHTTKQDAFDNKSEKWQEGETGTQMSEDLDTLQEIVDESRELYEKVENLFEE